MPDEPETSTGDDGWVHPETEPGVGPAAASTSPAMAVVAVVFVALLLWGAFALFFNSSDGDSTVPLGPAGTEMCEQAVEDAKDNIPDAVDDAQDSVDDIIAENPELAPYADDAKQQLADAAPAAEADLDAAGDDLGC